MKPYYESAGITLYHADARDVLPELAPDVIVTDPVWPNAHPDLAGSDDPLGLWNDILHVIPATTHRLVVWLGCQSDPRFLGAVPARLPFLRVQYVRRSVPGYNGRCLVSGDVVYAFGDWPPSREGARVIPGECDAPTVPSERQPHPAARNYDAACWVLGWWGQGLICDPFAGTGTTLVAARASNMRAVGIEIDERHCETAARRLAQEVFDWSAK